MTPRKVGPRRSAQDSPAVAKKQTRASKTTSAGEKTGASRSKSKSKSKTTSQLKSKKRRARVQHALHVVTDGTGGLPRHILSVVLSQFPSLKTPPRYHPFCATPGKIRSVVSRLGTGALVFSALADPQLKASAVEQCREFNIAHFDLTGGCVAFIAEHTRAHPINDVSRVHAHDEQYLDRIDAWEFSLQHDDSRRLESIDLADIVLVGLSRVSKTPVSAFLGWMGYKVANVSLAAEASIPKELRTVRGKVVALTIQPKRLAEIRNRRLIINGFQQAMADRHHTENTYCDLRSIIREVMFAEQSFRKLKIPMIDTTTLTVEETAARVLAKLNRLA